MIYTVHIVFSLYDAVVCILYDAVVCIGKIMKQIIIIVEYDSKLLLQLHSLSHEHGLTLT